MDCSHHGCNVILNRVTFLGSHHGCSGLLMAIRGYDGKELWKLPTLSEVFSLNCHSMDLNKDGVNDCIASGRMGTLLAVDPTNGKLLVHSLQYMYNHTVNLCDACAQKHF